jgi:hypothetical protein
LSSFINPTPWRCSRPHQQSYTIIKRRGVAIAHAKVLYKHSTLKLSVSVILDLCIGQIEIEILPFYKKR